MLSHMRSHIDIFSCPACAGNLEVNNNGVNCLSCGNLYRIENDIPLLFWSNEWNRSKKDVTDIVKAFYERTPFPNYEEFENVGALIQKAQNTFFANLLNEQLPFNIRVLEVGCGTGQMTNFLGVANRYVFGADMCLNSLKLGQNFKEKNSIERVGFYQMNLFKPIFKEESFHLVLCNGVLHHTNDPYTGFQSISKLVKRGGYILIGLYNKYGRLITDFRRFIFNVTGNRFKFLDPRLRGLDRGETKKAAWFTDQYKHPHESKHTVGEVLKWFDINSFDFVYGIPNPKAFSSFTLKDSIFKVHSSGNQLDHFITQLGLFLKGSKEGGFFIMIGKRRSN
jgi:2-polyprenyl-3-methyl-5-hydroxy-6-metoxy-1,4-benzoquinol methylase